MRNIYVYRLCFRLCSIFLPMAIFHHTTYTKSTIQSSSEHQGDSYHLWEHPGPSPVLSPEGLRGIWNTVRIENREAVTIGEPGVQSSGCRERMAVGCQLGTKITTVTIRWISRLEISRETSSRLTGSQLFFNSDWGWFIVVPHYRTTPYPTWKCQWLTQNNQPRNLAQIPSSESTWFVVL